MINKQILVVAMTCVLLSLLGCKSGEKMASPLDVFKSKKTANSSAKEMIEASLRTQALAKNNQGLAKNKQGLAKNKQDPKSSPKKNSKDANAIAKRMIEDSLRQQVLTRDNPGINSEVSYTKIEPRVQPSTRLASHQSNDSQRESDDVKQVRYQSPAPAVASSYPIDFPTVLRLAGADNWNVKLASQRVSEAAAEYCAAKSEWMPSLTVSLGYNKHEGEIQGTLGNVVTASRNSLFLGGGAGVQNSPLNGGSGGPPRMFVDFSLADAFFKPLSAKRLLGAEQARKNRVFNDTMLEASLGYYELVRAQSQLAIAQTNVAEAEEVARLTGSFVQAGKGTSADNSRIAVILNSRRQQVLTAEADLGIASARLATILQLDPTKLNPEMGLVAMESNPVPMNLTGMHFDLNTTIQQAQNLRCEIAEANARTHSARADMMAEQWRPWLPNLYLGYSGGVFGGGEGGDLPNLDGRSDLDIVIAWQVKNLGVGTRARQDATRSQLAQRSFETQKIRDQIAEQVTTTYQRVNQFQSMMGILAQNVQEAGSGLEKNLSAIKGLEGLPLEAIASLEQLANARTEYLSSVINFNQWQVRLLRAAGQSLGADAELGQVASCNVSGCDVDLPKCKACFQKPSRCKCNRMNPIRSLGSKLLSHDRSCRSCGGGGCSTCQVGQQNGYFNSNSCSRGNCGLGQTPSRRIGDSYLSNSTSNDVDEPRLSIGRPPRLAWYEESDEISR